MLALRHVKPGKSLIDVGCGTGEFLVQLKDRFNSLAGIDVSPDIIEFTSRKIKNYKNISLYRGELHSFNFPSEHFDVCLCLDVLEHVPNYLLLFEEVYRILRKDGDLIVTIPNKYDKIVSKVLRRNPLHIRTFTPWHWMGISEKTGFKIRFLQSDRFSINKFRISIGKNSNLGNVHISDSF